MQFLTIREPRSGWYTTRFNTTRRGMFFQFESKTERDPLVEYVCAIHNPVELGFCCPREFWPHVESAFYESQQRLKADGMRLVCTRVTIPRVKFHDVDTEPHGIRAQVDAFFHYSLREWAKPIDPLLSEWLTTDVIALAKGIRADAATDRYPILSDALRDAGCEDALIHDHLQLCPDHGPSCWVVEMILDPIASR